MFLQLHPWGTIEQPPPRCASWNRRDVSRFQQHMQQQNVPRLPVVRSDVLPVLYRLRLRVPHGTGRPRLLAWNGTRTFQTRLFLKCITIPHHASD